MKIERCLVALGIITLLAGCASQRVVLVPVGPSPLGNNIPSSRMGYLRVFSEREPIEEGDDPVYYQHTDYKIYDARGKVMRQVGNTNGHFDTSPRAVSLPPGRYTVKARAKDYLSVWVPVIIEPGRTTSVHLDDRWACPTNTPRNEFVFEPTGSPVGWKAEAEGGAVE